ncbi:flavodoxin family protein [Rivibacter subsaxonicus]|uniref:Flavoprotein WrbA n=1 Tax=Rivibacter subsaxonicus TaxID=457575 RepID=A0A4Q7W118_9BURK|nr:flavodoxin family protein [Rivibacter subsaxonicus]RZU02598.1 multimeric flavodoxin WrbA [Rivibacter subsaxonicus]
MTSSSKIVVVYHSGYGHTQKVAEAVAESARASLLKIDAEGNLPEAGWEQLAAADMIVFGSPTYMGTVSWQFKKFADASSKPWFRQAWKNKLFAGFTNSATMNGDKHSTLHYFMTLAMQHSGLWVGTGLMPNNSKAATRDDINYVGSFAGLMTVSPSDASPEEMVAGDIATAKAFGGRLLETAAHFAG